MSNHTRPTDLPLAVRTRPLIITFIGTIVMIILVVATLDISRRNIDSFVSDQQKYILSIECSFLVVFLVEMLARLVTLHPRTARMAELGSRLRFIVRIVGYCVGLLSIVSILASNAALGISVGALVGALLVFSTQSIVGSVLAAVVIVGTRIVRVGEEINVVQITGTVSDINLTHTVISVEDDVVYIPNSVMITNAIRRKKRHTGKGTGPADW